MDVGRVDLNKPRPLAIAEHDRVYVGDVVDPVRRGRGADDTDQASAKALAASGEHMERSHQ